MPMRRRSYLLLILALLALGSFAWMAWPKPEQAPPVAAEPVAPTFEDYLVDTDFDGTPVRVDFTGNDPALMFRTVIRNAAADGPNFAGAYTVATWGCGTACQQNAVIDAWNGRIVAYNLMTTDGVAYRLDSRLLIAQEPSATIEGLDSGLAIPSYYIMTDGKLQLVGRMVDGKYAPFVQK